jgi:hypothetical protein
MKGIITGLKFVSLVVGGMVLLVGDVQAQLNMPAREGVQTVVWVVELVTFLAILGIVLFIWRISKKDSENRNTRQDDI